MERKHRQKKLTSKQKHYLRGLGHHLRPGIMLGREGLTDNFISAAAAVLDAHELIKVKVGNGCPMDKREAAEAIAGRTGSEVVQVLGNTVIVFRENPERHHKHRIKLPE